MKWILLFLWVSSILFSHFRGRVRLPLSRLFLDHSVIFAPINAVMIFFSKVPTTPYVSVSEFPELKVLEDNWQIFREEALNLSRMQRIKASENHDDIGFGSFFQYGWKRFYLKWYGANHPSAAEFCPNTFAILKSIPSVKAAMFAELPAGGRLNKHRDPYAGSLRYHLGLITPNEDSCYIEVDGQQYSWRDGKGVIFDETYIHEAHNKTAESRIILFCDIERPVTSSMVAMINKWFSKNVMTAGSSPNDIRDRTGVVNQLAHFHHKFEKRRREFKRRNHTAYKITKYFCIALLILWFIFF